MQNRDNLIVLSMHPSALNYHHLHYFWIVAREGSIAKACKRLHVTQPTISGQMRALEKTCEAPLFERHGRKLVLTDLGRHVLSYCDEIFTLGHDLASSLSGQEISRPARLIVGVAEEVPKLIAYQLLAPVLALKSSIQLTIREDDHVRLCAALATHDIDLMLSISPLDSSIPIRAFSHLLGESTISLFAVSSLAKQLRKRFPVHLEQAPMLLHDPHTHLRRAIDHWCEDHHIHPRIVAEFQDSALMKAFGQAGAGAFPAPDVITTEICRQYQVERIAALPGVIERYYAISPERRIKNPAVQAIITTAKKVLR